MTDLENAKISGKARIDADYEVAVAKATVTVNQTEYIICGGQITITYFEIAERAAKAKGKESVKFRDCNNKLHTLPVVDFGLLIDELSVYGNAQWERKVELQAQIDLATTVDEILAIVW